MITKTDLSQIRKVIREEIEAEHDEIQSEIKLFRIQIESRLSNIEDKLKDLTIKGNKHDLQLTKILRDIAKIRKDNKYMVDFFDKEYIVIKKRVEKLESIIFPKRLASKEDVFRGYNQSSLILNSS
ncbi:MAG: hypothetical protein Q8Q15_02535 [bacterium]|nr:hypothetical protein [bacterium]